MPTHRLYGHIRVAGQPVVRRVDVVDAAAWAADGLAAAILGSATSAAEDGYYELLLDSDALVIALSPPVPPHAAMMIGPCRPEPL